MDQQNNQQPPQYNYNYNYPAQKKSSGARWFWGILISIVVIVMFFTGLSFLFFAKVISSGVDRNDRYEYEYREGKGKGKIAIVDLDFTIISSEPIVRQFKKYREDKSIKAIVLRVNTPGGGVAASQEMYEEIKKTRDSGKPVIVSFGSIAASGGYYAACGGSIIVSNPGSLTGSIGVIMSFVTIQELAKKLGIDETTIKSGELKDSGSPFRYPTEQDKQYFQDIVDDSFEQFLEVVSKERKISMEELKKIATGRVFTGRQAQKLGLVDSIGTFEDAIKIAAKMGDIEGDPTIVKEKYRLGVFEKLIEGSASSELKELKDELKNEFIDKPILQYKFEK